MGKGVTIKVESNNFNEIESAAKLALYIWTKELNKLKPESVVVSIKQKKKQKGQDFLFEVL